MTDVYIKSTSGKIIGHGQGLGLGHEMSMRKPQKQQSIRIPPYFIYLTILVYSLTIYWFSWGKEVELPSSISLYSNQAGDNLKQTFVTAIGDAKESVICMIYSLNDEEIIQAFKNKADEGVEVFIVTDPVATQDAKEKLGPKITVHPKRQKGLMHNKLLAVDKKVSWLGSANFTSDSLHLHANLVMGIVNPILANTIEEKAKSIHEKGRKFTPLTLATKTQNLDFSFLPDDGTALHKLINQLGAAKKTIKVAMFTFTHPDLIAALVNAHKRGVDVEVVLDSDSSRKTSNQAYRRFCQEKMKIYTSRRVGLLHEKMAIIDDTTLIMGSANWTKAAFTQNSENITFLYPLTDEQQIKLKAFWQTTLKEAKLN